MKKKKNGRKKFNNFKKTIKDFIRDEEGYINKENILKIGLGTISALGVLSSMLDLSVAAHSSHNAHVNQPYVEQQPVAGTQCYRFVAVHGSHASHANTHSSY